MNKNHFFIWILLIFIFGLANTQFIFAQNLKYNNNIDTVTVPYFEDFENAVVGTPGTLPVEWANETDDDFDWYVDNDGTPSSATGPEVDHTLGTAAGKYMYTESSSPNYPNMVAHLTSPVINYNNPSAPYISFWYHMFGTEMGELHVDIYQNGIWNLDVISPIVGQQQYNQNEPWLQAIVDLIPFSNTSLKARFRAITGSGYTSDIAIDDIIFADGGWSPAMVVNPLQISDTLLIGSVKIENFKIFSSFPSGILYYSIEENPEVAWLTVTPDTGIKLPFDTVFVDVNLNSSGLVSGVYSTQLIVKGNDIFNPSDTVDIMIHVVEPPVINVIPTSYNKWLAVNQIKIDTLTISNSGLGPLNFSLTIEEVADLKYKKNVKTKNKTFITHNINVSSDFESPNKNVIVNNVPEGYPKYLNRTETSIPELMHYKFNEAGYTATYNYANGFTRVNELAFIRGALTMGGTGQRGAALVGTGGSSDYDYVDTNWQTNLGTGDWAISLWLNNMDMTTDLHYYFGDNTASNFRCFSGGSAGPNNLMLRGPVSDVLVTGVAPGPSVVDFVYESAIPEIRAYLNGVLNNVVPQSGVNIVGTDQFKIGGYGSSNSMGASELMDEFKMWNSIPTVYSWLIPATAGGIIPAGSEMNILLTFDASGLFPGDFSSNIVIASNDPTNPFVTVSADLNVYVSPPIVYPYRLDFGYVFTGTTDTLIFEVSNLGTTDLIVSDMIVSTAEFTVLDTTPLVITIGMSDSVKVVYQPNVTGTHVDSVVLTHNFYSGRDVVFLSGEGINQPVIGLIPQELTGSVSEGETDSTVFPIYNQGVGILYYGLVLGDFPFTKTKLYNYSQNEAQNGLKMSEKNEILNQTEYSATEFSESLWDIQLMFSMQSANENFNAGAEFDGIYFYSTNWMSDLIRQYDCMGNFIREFTIAGVYSLRDLAFDGNYFYGGNLSNIIYIMDFATQSMVGTITTPEAVRSIAYNDDLDAFYIASFSTDIYLIDRNGNTLSKILASTHGLSNIYGTAYDNISDGGPYLWAFHQGVSGQEALISQLDLATGFPTGITHDVTTELPLTSPVAGGLFTTTDLVYGKVTLGGCARGNPDMMICYELAEDNRWVTLDHKSGSIAPGDSGTIKIYWHGIVAGHHEGYLGVYSNDPVHPVENVRLILDVLSSVNNSEENLPTKYALHQNYPNPFNPTTTIKYDLKENSFVNIAIYNILGEKVRTLINQNEFAGFNSVIWDGLNDAGEQVSTGVYIYKLEVKNTSTTLRHRSGEHSASKFIQSRKMIYMK